MEAFVVLGGSDAASRGSGDVDDPFDAVAAGHDEAVEGAAGRGTATDWGGLFEGADTADEVAADDFDFVTGGWFDGAERLKVCIWKEMVYCCAVDVHLPVRDDGIDVTSGRSTGGSCRAASKGRDSAIRGTCVMVSIAPHKVTEVSDYSNDVKVTTFDKEKAGDNWLTFDDEAIADTFGDFVARIVKLRYYKLVRESSNTSRDFLKCSATTKTESIPMGSAINQNVIDQFAYLSPILFTQNYRSSFRICKGRK